MTIGGSLFLIAVGAILRYAVKDSISGIDLQTAGLILMLVGVVGLLFAIYFTFVRRNPRYDDPRYVDDPRYADPPPRR